MWQIRPYSYFSLIKAIAAGNHKLGNIAAALETKQSNLTKYLKVLIDLDIIEREVPVTEGNPEKSKKGLYFIKAPSRGCEEHSAFRLA